MKKSIILVLAAVMGIVASCTKKDMSDNFNIDTQKYENQLSQDYNQANNYHLALISSNGQKALLSKTNLAFDSTYNKMMYNKCDSLFSQHFYLFCMDMMQNSGMMGGNSSSGMMGGNSNMMGSGGTMHGGTMGSTQDMNSMMTYIDSLHSNIIHTTNPNYMMNDSLIHNQMTMCNMMINQTVGVENIFNNMQVLRKRHQKIY